MTFLIDDSLKNSYSINETCFRMDLTNEENELQGTSNLSPESENQEEPIQWEETIEENPWESDEETIEQLLDRVTLDDEEDETLYFIRGAGPMSLQEMKVRTFYQKEGETLEEAWQRMRSYMGDLPEDLVNDEECLELFYNGLHVYTQEVLDTAAGGYFLSKTASERYQMLHTRSYERWSDPPDSPRDFGEIPGSPIGTDSEEEETDPDTLNTLLLNVLLQQTETFIKVQGELENLREEVKIRNSMNILDTEKLGEKLDELIHIQGESPFGRFRNGEDVSLYSFMSKTENSGIEKDGEKTGDKRKIDEPEDHKEDKRPRIEDEMLICRGTQVSEGEPNTTGVGDSQSSPN